MSESAGKVNQYVCEKCRAVHGTILLNTGVTPFLIGCKNDGCGGMAQSRMYNLPSGQVGCGWAWYRPTIKEFNRLTAGEQEHVLSGGLILGDLETVVNLIDTDQVHEMLTNSEIDVWLSYVASAYIPDNTVFRRVVSRLKGE